MIRPDRATAEAYEKKHGVPLVLDAGPPPGFLSKKESEWLANEQERNANTVRAEVEAAAAKLGIPSREIVGVPTWQIRHQMARITAQKLRQA